MALADRDLAVLSHVFLTADRLRRLTGAWLDTLGLGPVETPARLVRRRPGFELVAYGAGGAGPVVLLVPAPIKRFYIWDLAPGASVVRRCLERGMIVYGLRWTDPTAAERELGLAEYADGLLAEALDALEAETGGRRPILAGHSLGGTFAAIFAAARPGRVRGLVLVEAPLAFGLAGAGAFPPLLAAGPPARWVTTTLGDVPGTALDLIAIAAAPDALVWQRWVDRVLSLPDAEARRLHWRVERWALDELAMPPRLFEDVVEQLYRQDRFMRRALVLGGRPARPEQVTAPVLAVLDPRSRLVPPASVRPFLRAAGTGDTTVLEYTGDRGVSLQHVGALVGPSAHRHLWPRILDWAAARP